MEIETREENNHLTRRCSRESMEAYFGKRGYDFDLQSEN